MDDTQITTLNNYLLPLKLGESKLVYSKHTFIHFIDLGTIINQFNDIESKFLTIKNFIDQENSSNPISYHGLSQNILLRTETLTQITLNKLKNLHPHIRSKRGLLNIVGKANKWLFGTLDSDDGERYNNIINKLKNDHKNIINEVNMQISLSKNLINNYNKTITILSKNQENLNYGLRLFQNAMNKQISNLHDYISLQGILTQINLDCQNIITFLDNIEDAIMFAKLNTLHNSILPSSELEHMLNYLKSIYNENQIPKFKNILSYYQFFGTQISFSNTKLIFAIHVPIVQSNIFTFYHLYPIIQNHKVFIPKYPYLARAVRNQFEESICPKLEDTFYCIEDFHPEDRCTLQLIEDQSIENCDTLNINVQEAVVQQITQNEVLILPNGKDRIFSKCKIDQYIEIDKPSLIKIPEKCEIEINNKKYFNDVQIDEGKPLILPSIKFEQINTLNNYETINISRINMEEIYQLRKMANQLIPVWEESLAEKSTPIISIILFVMVILTLVFVLYKKKIFNPILARLKKTAPTNEENQPEEVQPKESPHFLLS